MNENDSERMYSLLEMSGYHAVPTPDLADLIIINSCSVREKPVHKVFSEVGTYRRLKEKNPKLKIGVGGCVASLEKERLIEKSPLIDFVFGTDNIDLLPQIVERIQESSQKLVEAQFRHREAYQTSTLVRNPKVSVFVNIMKGCDNFCSFCVVPFTRGREKSRSLQEVVQDVQALVEKGVKEVTLLGQNVNSYRSPCGADFADLLEALARRTSVVRIRYTTSHPKDFNEKLAQVMKDYHSVICEYIHLPVQSGSSEILQRMNRGYTRQEYLEKIKMIRSILPEAVFSTDLIVGFPGETEEQFQDTLTLLEEVGFETVFAFKYSPRPFTKAARFAHQVAEPVKEQRLQRLFERQEMIARQIVKRYENQVVEVLVESFDQKRGNWFGRSRENKNVYFSGDETWSLLGQKVHVLVEKAHPTVFRGTLLRREQMKEAK